MKIYLLSQNEQKGCDTYDSCVVVAKTPLEAKKINPGTYHVWMEEEKCWGFKFASGYIGEEFCSYWANHLKNITCECIGEAKKSLKAGTILCASFNAG